MARREVNEPPVAVVAQPRGRVAGWFTGAVFSIGVAAALLGGAAAASASGDTGGTTGAAGATSQSPSRHGGAGAGRDSRTVTGPVRRVRPAATVAAATVPGAVVEAAAPAPTDCRVAGKAGCFQTRDAYTAPLTAVNMVIGQLTGTVPSLAETAQVATGLKSGSASAGGGCTNEAKKCPWYLAYQKPADMYSGLDSSDWMTNEDGYSLLASTKDGKSLLAPAVPGFRVTGSFYPKDQFPVALKNLTTALAGGKSAIVVLTSRALTYQAEQDKYADRWHAVTVLSVDEANNKVYINDGALPAVNKTDPGTTRANLELSLTDFQKYWSVNDFQTAIVELKANGTQSASAETLDALSRDLARQYDSPALVSVPAVPAVPPFFTYDPGDVVYGNPNVAVTYWQYQGPRNTCVLASSAMVIGQLTTKMPPLEQIIVAAKAMASDVYKKGSLTARKQVREGNIYSPELDEFVYYVDAVKLLAANNVSATYNFYPRSDPEWAFSNLTSALGSGKSVIVSINQVTAYSLLTDNGLPAGLRLGDHAITVLGVNTTRDEVYLNDAALNGEDTLLIWGGAEVATPQGQGITMKLGDFLTAWKRSSYLMLTCTQSQSGAVAPQQSAIAA